MGSRRRKKGKGAGSRDRRGGSDSAVRGSGGLANVALALVIVVGLIFLLWNPLGRHDAGVTSDASSPITGPPSPTFSESVDGVRIARFDVARLTAWCRDNGLPDPPQIQNADATAAKTLMAALADAAANPGATSFGRAGQVCEGLEAHQAAAAYFERAARADPTDYRWPYYLGRIHQSFGRSDQALQMFRTVLRLKPDQPMTHARLGQLYLDLDRNDEAEVHFRRYAELRPTDWLSLVGLGRVAMRRGDHEAALRFLKQAEQIGPNDAQVQRYLGRVYAAMGVDEKARSHFAAAASLPPGLSLDGRDPLMREVDRVSGTVNAMVSRFERMQHSGDWATMIELGEQIIRRRARDTAMMGNLASIYRKVGRFAEAHEMIDRALAITPDSARLRVIRAEVLLAEGKPEAAVVEARASLEIDGESSRAYNALGRSLFMLKRQAEAEAAMGRAAELDPDSPSIALVLGEVLVAGGKLDAAAECYRRVLEHQPGHELATQRLAAIAAHAR
jgi:tetratricopeptide (TPR) repeat protein